MPPSNLQPFVRVDWKHIESTTHDRYRLILDTMDGMFYQCVVAGCDARVRLTPESREERSCLLGVHILSHNHPVHTYPYCGILGTEEPPKKPKKWRKILLMLTCTKCTEVETDEVVKPRDIKVAERDLAELPEVPSHPVPIAVAEPQIKKTKKKERVACLAC
ncbi:hypothetical protein L596_009040 [Steinernema carpocapsae]|nr:hypothetical protein L596_009040 [Steinernema carpocapsae]